MNLLQKNLDYILENIETIDFNHNISLSDKEKTKVIERLLLVNSYSELIFYAIYDVSNNKILFVDKYSCEIISCYFEFTELELFKLDSTIMYPELNGLNFNELPGRYKRRLKEIRTRILYINVSESNNLKDNFKECFK